jgi:hypothetical protein
MRTVTALFILSLCAALGAAAPDHKATKADVERWMTELSNWGRWGKTDQRRTIPTRSSTK